MKTYKVLEVDTIISVYHVVAISEGAAINKIEAAFADINHPDITLIEKDSDIVNREYQCEGEIENENS